MADLISKAQEFYDSFYNKYTKARIVSGEYSIVKCKPDDKCGKCCKGFRIELTEVAKHFDMDIQKVHCPPFTIVEHTLENVQ